MPRYAMLSLIGIISILIVYLLVIPASMSWKRKILVLILSLNTAALMYFAVRDILGRADPYPRPGKYTIRFVEKNKRDGKIYVYVTGKRGDPNFEPRLLLLNENDFNGGKSHSGTKEMLEIGQEGDGQLQLELQRKDHWYGPNESVINVQDPLMEILDHKNE